MVRKNRSARRTAILGLLAASAVAISAAENMLPAFPFMPPGAKLGLSNIITMFLAMNGMISPALFIALAKGAFALLTRGVTAGAMSAAGGVLSALVIFILSRSRKFGLIGLGVAGAAAHNAAQLAVAVAVMGGAMICYIPILLIFAVLTGTVTAILLKYLIPTISRLELDKNGNGGEKP